MLGALADMAILVVTKDCTALSDSDLVEMADLAEVVGSGFEIGVLSKQAEAWVLVTLARRGDTLAGFSFCTLEGIGGTPSVLVGLACWARDGDCADVLSAMMRDQLRRAVVDAVTAGHPAEVVVDLIDVPVVDDGAVQALIAGREAAQRTGIPLRLARGGQALARRVVFVR